MNVIINRTRDKEEDNVKGIDKYEDKKLTK